MPSTSRSTPQLLRNYRHLHTIHWSMLCCKPSCLQKYHHQCYDSLLQKWFIVQPCLWSVLFKYRCYLCESSNWTKILLQRGECVHKLRRMLSSGASLPQPCESVNWLLQGQRDVLLFRRALQDPRWLLSTTTCMHSEFTTHLLRRQQGLSE